MTRLPVLAVAVAVIVLAAPAQADPDPQDAQFIAALKQTGITYTNPDKAVAAAKEVCALMGAGESGAAVVQQMTRLNPGFAEAGAQKFAAIAASVYCPQYVSSASSQPPAPPGPG